MKAAGNLKLIQGCLAGVILLNLLGVLERMSLGIDLFPLMGVAVPTFFGGIGGTVLGYLFLTMKEKAAESNRVIDRLIVEVDALKLMEEELLETHDELEMRVQERTLELSGANERLKTEVVDRQRAENLVIAQRDLSVQLNGLTDLNEALGLCIDTALEISGMDSAGVYLVNDDSCLDLAVHTGLPDEFVRGVAHLPADSLHTRLVENASPIYTRYTDLLDPSSCRAKSEGLRAIAVLPILHELRPIACLSVASHTLDEVPAESRHALEAIAALVGNAIARIQAEEALRESEERYRILTENSLTGIFVHQDGLQVYVNDRFAEIFGYTPEEMLGKPFYEVVHPDDLDFVKRGGMARSVGKTIIPPHYECRVLHRDARTKWVEVRATTITYGGRTAALGNIYDITDRKRSEEALQESEEKYRTIIENIEEGYYEVDLAGNFVFFNDSMCRILGYTRSELTGMNNRDYMDEATARDVYRTFKKIYTSASRSSDTFACDLIRKDGTVRNVEASVSLLKDSSGEVRGFRGICMDVTDRRRGEQLLLQTERYKAVSDLAGGVAHNFNNLLQIVMGGAQLVLLNIRMGNLAKSRATLEQILDTCRLGAETVQRLQAFAGMREDGAPAETTVFDLSDLVNQAAEMSAPWWKTNPEKEGRHTNLKLSLKRGCLVQGKKSELFEVLVNLIKNASEALIEGGDIEIQTTIREDRVNLSVRDTGVGIPKNDLARVFNPFYTTKISTGTGLGLATSRAIIHEHGGRIFVESVEEEGSVFTIQLPPATVLPDEASPASEADLGPRLSILVIDDENALAGLLCNWLTQHDHTVFSAASGKEGIGIFEKNRFDLVICDLGMPEMNGWEVGKAIRTICQDAGVPRTPFVILTGWRDQASEKEKISEAGVDAIVDKPVDLSTLLEIVRQVVSDTPI